MLQTSVKGAPKKTYEKRSTRFISQIFGTHLDFSNYETVHPIIQLFLFGKKNEEELAELKNEIQWILQADENIDETLIDNFLIALEGLKQTINYYEIYTFREIIDVLKAEKREFQSLISCLKP